MAGAPSAKKSLEEKKVKMREDWVKRIEEHFVGRTIKKVFIMPLEEADEMGWHQRPVIFELDNGHSFFASQDDEGNDGGSIFTTFEKLPAVPVFY